VQSAGLETLDHRGRAQRGQIARSSVACSCWWRPKGAKTPYQFSITMCGKAELGGGRHVRQQGGALGPNSASARTDLLLMSGSSTGKSAMTM